MDIIKLILKLKFRVLIIPSLCLFMAYMPSFAYAADTTLATPPSSEKVIGGFGAPIFLKQYDEEVINQITDNEQIKFIRISYPKHLLPLALKVKRKINSNEPNIQVKLKEINLTDTNTTKYRHDVISIVTYFKNPAKDPS